MSNYTAAQVAEIVGTSRRWVYVLADRVGIKKLGRDYAFDDVDLARISQAAVEARERGPGKPRG